MIKKLLERSITSGAADDGSVRSNELLAGVRQALITFVKYTDSPALAPQPVKQTNYYVHFCEIKPQNQTMELDGLPSTVMPPPAVTLTFDILTRRTQSACFHIYT